MSTDRSPNAESITYWNEDAGPRWARNAEAIDLQLAPFLDPLCRAAAVGQGERVLDIGCGAGALSLRLAASVGDGGGVLGVDISEQLLALARRRAGERADPPVEFRRADAQLEPFDEATFDRVVSRFGVMFFEDSIAAFKNFRCALRPGGTLSFVCWAPLSENPWMGIPGEVLLRHVEPPEPADPDGPGPFRFCEPEYARQLCGRAGFADVSVDRLQGLLILGGPGTFDDAISFMLEIGPAARVREAEQTIRLAVRDDLRRTMRPYMGVNGVELPYAAWLVHARCA